MPIAACLRRLALVLPFLLVDPFAAAQGIPLSVTSLANSGAGSFRAAIDDANRLANQAGPGNRITITFAANLAGQVIPVQGGLPFLLASFVTMQVAGTPAQPVILDLPESLVVSGDDLSFRDISFRRPASTVGVGDNVIMIGCRRLQFARCRFEDAPIAGLFLVGCPDTTITDCLFRSSNANRTGQGLLCQDYSDRTLITRCRFEGPMSRGASLVGVAECAVRNCTFQNVFGGLLISERCQHTEIGPGNQFLDLGQIGIAADLAGPLDPRNPNEVGLLLTGNTMRDGGSTAILLRNRCISVVIEGNVIERNGRDRQAQVVVRDSDRVAVRGNRIAGGLGDGLAIDGGRDIDVHGANVVETNVGVGVVVTGGATRVCIGPADPGGNVLGNTIRDNRGLAARFTGVVDCHLTGNTVQANGRTVIAGNTGPVVFSDGCTDCAVGPGVTITGGTAALEIRDSSRIQVDSLLASGYLDRGMQLAQSVDVQVRNCRFLAAAGASSGISAFGSSPLLLLANECSGHAFSGFSFVGCADVVVGPGNRAVNNGQFGFQFQRGSGPSSSFVTIQSSVAVNHAGVGAGIALQDIGAAVVNCTSAGNHRGIEVIGSATAPVSVINSVFWANRERDRIAGVTATAAMDHSIFASSQGPWSGGVGNRNANPQFVALATHDVRLQASSPALGAGSVFVSRLPVADADLEQRVRSPGVDCGAHERMRASALTMVGSVLRSRANRIFELDLDAGTLHAGRQRVLLIGASGTAPGLPLQGVTLPLQPDGLTTAWFASPAAIGSLDASGRERFRLEVPAPVMAVLPPELTFAFAIWPSLGWASNPVMVRLLP